MRFQFSRIMIPLYVFPPHRVIKDIRKLKEEKASILVCISSAFVEGNSSTSSTQMFVPASGSTKVHPIRDLQLAIGFCLGGFQEVSFLDKVTNFLFKACNEKTRGRWEAFQIMECFICEKG